MYYPIKLTLLKLGLEKEKPMSNVPELGGWSEWSSNFTEEAKEALGYAVTLGVNYKPLAFATQRVSGINYCFLCEAEIVIPNPPLQYCLIYVYVPLKGQPSGTETKDLRP